MAIDRIDLLGLGLVALLLGGFFLACFLYYRTASEEGNSLPGQDGPLVIRPPRADEALFAHTSVMNFGTARVAAVGAITNRKQTCHRWLFADGARYLPFPEVLLIEGYSNSVMLYRYRSDGTFCGDTWHESFEKAQESAANEYEEALGAWFPVPPETDNAYEYAIAFAHKRDNPYA